MCTRTDDVDDEKADWTCKLAEKKETRRRKKDVVDRKASWMTKVGSCVLLSLSLSLRTEIRSPKRIRRKKREREKETTAFISKIKRLDET
jgi:hypothetical protein